MDALRVIFSFLLLPAIITHILCLLTSKRKHPPGWFEGIATALIVGAGWIGYGLWTGSPIPKLGNLATFLGGAFMAVTAFIPAAFMVAFHCERRRRAARIQFVPDEIPESK